MKKIILLVCISCLAEAVWAQVHNDARDAQRIYLDSRTVHGGGYDWQMKKATDLHDRAEDNSQTGFSANGWMPAIVPGTVLQSLVYNQVFPEPYFGVNNKLSAQKIPDIAQAGRAFYTYWFRTEFSVPADYQGKNIWLQVDGVNYRAEFWLNGNLVTTVSGMFQQDYIDITDFARVGELNSLAVKVLPVDIPGTNKAKPWRARGENKNGGDGNIGLNTTMLMSVGWDFTFKDGIRDRNTGIWRSISLYSTRKVALRHPFVKTKLSKPAYDKAELSLSVELANAAMQTVNCLVKGQITGEDISFQKQCTLIRGEQKELEFTPKEYAQLVMLHPRLWWPVNKGAPALYELKLEVYINGELADSVKTKFGVREIRVDRNAPDSSKNFYINGRKIFIRGANWIPEGMLRNSDERMYAELRYTQQSGVNLLRLWGGGIAESDYFYQRCDEMGILVWQEFWLTGDTKHPHDQDLYLNNLKSTVKRIRNHPSLIFYVASNESTEVSGTRQCLMQLDGTRPYQMQSETDGVHDGSPYQQVNPMQHYENTASNRGSRVDGFNPEYGAPSLPTVEALYEMMEKKDLWPINKEVWDYLDGNGFHGMTTIFKNLVDQYGASTSIEEFAEKAQLLNAMNAKSIWEVWNENKFEYGDRYCSGLLFWYLNSPVRQVCGRMWDWSLEPTAALYYTQNALAPLHAQFDYIRNTVSVYNDYFQSFSNYKLVADVYDLDSKRVFSQTRLLKTIGEDAVLNDVLKLVFPQNISPVHFIRLSLQDNKGKEVANSFYWRSTDTYTGKETLTGPASGGFAPLESMKKTTVKSKYSLQQKGDRFFLEADISNPTKQIAFFVQLQLLDADGAPVRPAFYTDNFFSLLPGETRHIRIETANARVAEKNTSFVVRGWNIRPASYPINKKR
ncbi:MAG: glycoside hydrolase family 2 [Terrimonas sp.]|nr:glycoside hydrolase family 2 [Terrimonas sp.]